MAVLDILKYPDARLHTVAERVPVVDDRIRKLVADMAETMYAAPGIGLAAIGADRMPQETANQFLYRVERLLDADNAALAHDIVATYNRMRYDPEPGPAELLAQLRGLVRAFRP